MAGGALLLGLFFQVGHYADGSFRLWCVALVVLGLAAGLDRRRFLFYAGFFTLSGSRLLAFLNGTESHNLLFPGYLGLSAGLLLNSALLAFRRSQPLRSNGHTGVRTAGNDDVGKTPSLGLLRPDSYLAWILLLAIALIGLLVLRTFVQAYSVQALLGAGRVDRMVAPGVSANFSFYLTMLPALHLCGPLLAFGTYALFARKQATAGASSLLLGGLAWGALANFVTIAAQLGGMDWLYLSSGRSQAAARPPGLLTDSGMMTILLPLLIAFAYLWWQNLNWSGRLSRGLAIGAGLLGTLVGFALQGRAYVLSVAGVAVWLYLTFLRPTLSAQARRYLPAALGLVLLVVLGAMVALSFVSPNAPLPSALVRLKNTLPGATHSLLGEGPLPALARVDPARAQLWMAGQTLIARAPWSGHGLNQFMVQTARLSAARPELPRDNPAVLWQGLIVDVGFLGSICLLAFAGLYLLGGVARADLTQKKALSHQPGEPNSSNMAARALYWVPLSLLPATLVGYHIVSAEFAALLLMPLLLEKQSVADPGRLDRYRRALLVLLALSVATYAAVVFAGLVQQPL